MIASGVLSLGVLFPLAPAVQHRAVAMAAALNPVPHSVRLVVAGDEREIRTSAVTVADLLREQQVNVSAGDALDPSADTLLADGMRITYRAALPYTLYVAGVRQDVSSAATDVRGLLAQRNVTVGPNDSVVPPLDQNLDGSIDTIRVIHTEEWTEVVRTKVPPVVEHRLSLSLAPAHSKTVSAGTAGLREDTVTYRRVDYDPNVTRRVVSSRTISHGKPKIVVSGVVAYEKYSALAARGFLGTMRLANAAMRMVATAYTANCSGCSGYTAIGVRAGRGIVAVDPRIIPLGTKLYIPGYGVAVAGDTGGSIHGNRIDLGFDTTADAMSFGRRAVQVFVLR